MKIILAVDSSAASEVAIQAVAARPWPAGSTVEVLTVVEPWEIPALLEGQNRSAMEMLQRAFHDLRARGIETTSKLLSGEPKAVIIDRASETHADLVVMGSRGVSGLSKFLLGSVTAAVARFAPCSVEIVRPAVRDEDHPTAIRVLLATDGSECSEVATRSIAERPWPAGSEVHILSVVELSVPLFRIPYPPYFDSHAMEELRAQAMQRTEEVVMAAEKIITDAGLTETATVAVPSATPKELILEEAQRWGADIIVMGSHGRRGINRFLLGSVSEAVAAHAHCSVEIIRN
ncbi:MAG: universal stress protein [Bryobacteraceae bacterium]|jgi:nucleotide-binding universal stress UspA family protein